MEEKLDRLFHLKERGTTVKTEVLAGLTTFVTAAYVLAVNPSVMSATGMDSGAIFTAAALVCFLGTLVSVFSFSGGMADGTSSTAGISVVLFCMGLVITGVRMARNVKGNILLGILITSWCSS